METNARTPLPKNMRRIGVMTSGGDAPGMNGAVRAVVRMGIARGCEVFCIHEGYEGLIQGGDMIKRAEWDDVRGFLQEGGTLIGTARCPAFRERAGRLKAAKHMIEKGIDALVVCGGDGSLTGADTLREEWPGLLDELVQTKALVGVDVTPFKKLTIVGIVGSIDNDMALTDATIGCFSSLHRICECVDSINDTAQSHQRAFIVEVMGRNCGWLALMAGISTGADYTFIPEHPPSESWKTEMCSTIQKHRALGKRTSIIIIAEGAIDRDLKKITPDMIKHLLTDLGLDTRVTTLGHVQRGGAPCAYDRLLSSIQGAEAVNTIMDANLPSSVIAINENEIVRQSLVDAVRTTLEIPVAIQNKDFDKAMRLRSNEFTEYYKAHKIMNAQEQPELLLPENERLRIGMIHVGAPCGGMNAATRAAVAYCFARGHTPVMLHNGFSGLIRHHSDKPQGAVRDITWLEADTWVSRGGSEIGTNRTLPSENMKEVAYVFEHYNIQALFMVGGFEAFTALSELRQARNQYDSLKIPMVVLPATVSNNVPGTEYSLGSDTCLNSLIYFCDTCRQSGSSSRRRIFVVETQGGESGYIAMMAGIAIGALAVYTPEEGITLKMIDRDIDHLRETFARDRGQSRSGKIILRNEKASKTYTTKLITDMIQEEGKGRFDAREAVPGHFQQGRQPSPMDRVRAVRFAVRSLQHLERFSGNSKGEILDDPMSCSIIGIQGAKVELSSMAKVENEETDWKHRRPIKENWAALKGLGDALSGRFWTDENLKDPKGMPV